MVHWFAIHGQRDAESGIADLSPRSNGSGSVS